MITQLENLKTCCIICKTDKWELERQAYFENLDLLTYSDLVKEIRLSLEEGYRCFILEVSTIFEASCLSILYDYQKTYLDIIFYFLVTQNNIIDSRFLRILSPHVKFMHKIEDLNKDGISLLDIYKLKLSKKLIISYCKDEKNKTLIDYANNLKIIVKEIGKPLTNNRHKKQIFKL